MTNSKARPRQIGDNGVCIQEEKHVGKTPRVTEAAPRKCHRRVAIVLCALTIVTLSTKLTQ